LPKINLAFTPGFDFFDRKAVGATTSTPHDVGWSAAIPKTMLHRRLYLWHTATSGTWAIDGKIVFRCGGQIVGSMPYRIFSVSNNNNFSIGANTIAAPNTVDLVRVQLNGSIQAIAPFNIVIAADTVSLEGTTAKQAGVGTAISYFGIFSQHYW
jgi:hypothetical protein